MTNFLREARVLIKRVQESIYAEYGWGRSSITDDQVAGRKTSFGVYLVPPNEPKGKGIDAAKGIAWMYKDSFDHLVKKLLNAMMTNDHFFVILGGHSAAAGHGNNFHQSYMMQFQEVLEPVFDRLGMVLVSANRAQGGMGTVQASLAGETIFGEKDFMVWDSSMTEKGAGHQEVFMRQMLLTGHRVPILFDMGGGKGTLDRLYEEVGAYVGGLTSGNPPYIEETKSLEQAKNLPFAVQHLFCSSGNDSCTKNEYKYNAHCWTDRVDVEPPKPQSNKYGSQGLLSILRSMMFLSLLLLLLLLILGAKNSHERTLLCNLVTVSWHPGFRTHKWNGRRLSLLILQALDAAITLWEQNASSPLESKHWHLAAEEQTIRENLKKVDVAKTECGKLMANKVPRLCITPMRGATEWAPRADPDHSSMRSLLKPSPSGYGE